MTIIPLFYGYLLGRHGASAQHMLEPYGGCKTFPRKQKQVIRTLNSKIQPSQPSCEVCFSNGPAQYWSRERLRIANDIGAPRCLETFWFGKCRALFLKSEKA